MAGMKVRDIFIDTPVPDILQIIREEMALSGRPLFEKVRHSSDNTLTQCPFHGNGLENHPSFGISDRGECHCFACGWATTSFDVFVSAVFGYDDNGDFGFGWLCDHLDLSTRSIHLDFHKTPTAQSSTIISEAELDSYRYTHPYMYKRHLTDEIIQKFDIGYDRERQCLTFPIKDLYGNVVFVARRSVNSKFFILPEDKEKPIYLAYMFTSGQYKKAVICESFLNALTCWKFGIPAMALIGTGSYKQIEILQRLPVRHYVLALDPDEAGARGIARIKNNLRGKFLSTYIMPDTHSDLNDLDDKILQLRERRI